MELLLQEFHQLAQVSVNSVVNFNVILNTVELNLISHAECITILRNTHGLRDNLCSQVVRKCDDFNVSARSKVPVCFFPNRSKSNAKIDIVGLTKELLAKSTEQLNRDGINNIKMQLDSIKFVNTDKKINIRKANSPSELTRDYSMRICYVDIDKLLPYEHQARQHFDEEALDALADSMKLHGIRTPLTVVKAGEDTFQIISGERRWRAAKKIGLNLLPCVVNENAAINHEIALVENIIRENLSHIELLEGLERYISQNPNMTREMAQNKLGLSRTKFFNTLSLSTLSPEARKMATEKKFSLSKLMSIAKMEDEQQIKALKSERVLQKSLEKAMNKTHKVLKIKFKNGIFESEEDLDMLYDSSQHIIKA